MIYLIVTLAALVAPVQDRNAALQHTLDAWVEMWNSYDLDEVRRLFVADESRARMRRSIQPVPP